MRPYSATRRAFTGLTVLAALSLANHAGLAAGPAAEASPNMGDGGVVRVIDNPFSTQSYARIAIQKYKLDKKHGFQLEVTPAGNSTASMTAIQSGAAEISIFNYLDIARMRAAGVDVFGVGPFLELGADYYVAPSGSTIANIGDFKGKRVGISARTNVNWVVTVAVAKRVFNYDIEKEATVQEASPNLLRGLLDQGQLDVANIYNNLTPDLLVTGKYKIQSQVKDLAAQIGLPGAPFLLWGVKASYAKAHPGNVRAFLAAYREAVEILRTDDSAWVEHARELKMTDPAIALLREEMRADTLSAFKPADEANIRKAFDVFLSIMGPQKLGLSAFPQGFMTLDYQ